MDIYFLRKTPFSANHFLNLFSKRPREKKEEGKKEKKEKKKKEEKEEKKDFSYATNFIRISVTL